MRMHAHTAPTDLAIRQRFQHHAADVSEQQP